MVARPFPLAGRSVYRRGEGGCGAGWWALMVARPFSGYDRSWLVNIIIGNLRAEEGSCEVGSREVSVDAECSPQIGLAQIGPAQVGTAEVGHVEVCAA